MLFAGVAESPYGLADSKIRTPIATDTNPPQRKHPKLAVFQMKLQGSNFVSSSSEMPGYKLSSACSIHLSGLTLAISQLPKSEYMTALSIAPSLVFILRNCFEFLQKVFFLLDVLVFVCALGDFPASFASVLRQIARYLPHHGS